MITKAKLQSLYNYSAETGEFVRLTSAGGYIKNTIAGSTDTYGYRQLSIDWKKVLAHRLAWLFVYGALPDGEIDHINGNRSDNRIINLRLSSRSVNTQNIRLARKTSITGVLGVSPQGMKFQARINSNGKQRHLGTFQTKEEAHEAYLVAKRIEHGGCTI
jgi:hypothetical protein